MKGPKIGVLVSAGAENHLYGQDAGGEDGSQAPIWSFLDKSLVAGIREAVDDQGLVNAGLDEESFRIAVEQLLDGGARLLVVALQRADKVPRGDETLPWLFGVARNVVRHAERSNRRRMRLTTKAMREPTGTVQSPETQVIRRSEDEALAAGIGRLSQSDQEVVRLRAWEDLNAPAIAEVLGCSVSAAEKRVTRAFKRLEKTLRARIGVTTRQATDTKRGDA